MNLASISHLTSPTMASSQLTHNNEMAIIGVSPLGQGEVYEQPHLF